MSEVNDNQSNQLVASRVKEKLLENDQVMQFQKINAMLDRLIEIKKIQKAQLYEEFKQFYIDYLLNRNTLNDLDLRYLWILYQIWDLLITKKGFAIHLDNFKTFRVYFYTYLSKKSTHNYNKFKGSMMINIRKLCKEYMEIFPSYITEEIKNTRSIEKENKYYKSTTKVRTNSPSTFKEDEFKLVNRKGIQEKEEQEYSYKKQPSPDPDDDVFLNLSDLEDSSDSLPVPDEIVDNLIETDIYENVPSTDDDSDGSIVFEDD
jgi:hypothetical protein